MYSKPRVDVTGVLLTPSYQGRDCLGNGKHPEYECCCDECDFYLECFPQFNVWEQILRNRKEGKHIPIDELIQIKIKNGEF